MKRFWELRGFAATLIADAHGHVAQGHESFSRVHCARGDEYYFRVMLNTYRPSV